MKPYSPPTPAQGGTRVKISRSWSGCRVAALAVARGGFPGPSWGYFGQPNYSYCRVFVMLKLDEAGRPSGRDCRFANLEKKTTERHGERTFGLN